MKITKHPQSAILIEHKNKRILIDPGRYCYNEKFTPNNWGEIDILLITHTHSDHCVPEAIDIIKKNSPQMKVYSNEEVRKLVECEVIKPGEEIVTKGITIKGVRQTHGDLPSNKPKPKVIGFLIDNIYYHPGDSIYMKDKPKAKVLFVPICGRVVMNIEEAKLFAKEVEAKFIIPIHYDSPKYPVNIEDFDPSWNVLENGQSLEIEQL